MKRELRLPLKRKWFEMTKSGEKTEEYREINRYWISRLVRNIEYMVNYEDLEAVGNISFREFDSNIVTLGYPKSNDADRIISFEHEGIEIGTGNPEWGAEPGKRYFVIKHGKRL